MILFLREMLQETLTNYAFEQNLESIHGSQLSDLVNRSI